MRRRGDPSQPESGRESAGPELPAWKAFVVQFSREAPAAGGSFSGRIEHLSSGRRSRFSSREELLAALEGLLEELNEIP
jgi:hypothetical protein